MQQWRLDLMVLLAIHVYGHDDPRSQDPVEIVDLANRYAEAGTEPFLTQLDSALEFAVPKLYRITDLFIDEYAKAVPPNPRLY